MYQTIKFKLPSEVEYILNALEQNSFEAFVVGGCVRDSIIGRDPQDWDIATSAKPQEVKGLFPKTVDTGLQHGTVTVLINKQPYEITTYRIEGKYINNRKPETVEFTNSIEEDLSRRDFTINAMAYNPAKGLVDPFGGLCDIDAKQIKAVGNALHRFEEDALRMLRAVRFSAQLGYRIEKQTFEAIHYHCKLIHNISGERIRDELTKTLLANPMSFETLQSTGILKEILPELDQCFATQQNHPYHMYNVGMHSLHATSSIDSNFVLRWTMLLHDIGKPDMKTTDDKGIDHFYMHQKKSAVKAEKIMQRLRFDNASIAQIKKLIVEHDRQVGDNEKSVRKAMASIGVDLFESWMQVRIADIKAQHPSKTAERLEHMEKVKAIYRKILREKQCLSLKELAIDGKELMDMGIPQGKKLGEILQQLLEAVLEQPELNQRNTLLSMAKKLL